LKFRQSARIEANIQLRERRWSEEWLGMIEFHKVWIEQCEAAEGIKEQFGVKDATRYLIAEKLIPFMETSQERPEFAEELPKFVAQIKRIFTPDEMAELFDDLAAGEVPDPAKIFTGEDSDEGLDERAVLDDAGKILLVENAKALLLE
jgi:hypothetical protein